MMRSLVILLIGMLLPFAALAEDAVVAPPKTGSVFWDIISYILGIILVPVMGILAKMAMDWSATVSAKKADAQAGVRDKLKIEAEKVIARIAANIANDQLAKMKEAAKDGKVDKEELKKLGEAAVAEAKVELGPVVAKAVGEATLKSILRKKVDDMNSESK